MTPDQSLFVMKTLGLSAPELMGLLRPDQILPTVKVLRSVLDHADFLRTTSTAFELLIRNSSSEASLAPDIIELLSYLPNPASAWRKLSYEIVRTRPNNGILKATLLYKKNWPPEFAEVFGANLNSRFLGEALDTLRDQAEISGALSVDFIRFANMALDQYHQNRLPADRLLLLWHFIPDWTEEIWRIWLIEWYNTTTLDENYPKLLSSLINHTNWPERLNIVQAFRSQNTFATSRLLLLAIANQRDWPSDLWPLIKPYLIGQNADSLKLAALAAVATQSTRPPEIEADLAALFAADPRLKAFFEVSSKRSCEAELN